jgi:hypothetical protein
MLIYVVSYILIRVQYVTPHNKLILICDKAAYVTLLLKNLDLNLTDVSIGLSLYGYAAVCRSVANNPQWDLDLFAPKQT